jgi:hypothetical protein
MTATPSFRGRTKQIKINIKRKEISSMRIQRIAGSRTLFLSSTNSTTRTKGALKYRSQRGESHRGVSIRRRRKGQRTNHRQQANRRRGMIWRSAATRAAMTGTRLSRRTGRGGRSSRTICIMTSEFRVKS